MDYVQSDGGNGSYSMEISGGLLHLYSKYNSGNGVTVQYGAANAVDVTDYSTLVLVIDSDDGWCNASLGCWSSKSGTTTAGTYTNIGNMNFAGTHTLDISGLTGNMYPAVRTWVGTNNTKNIYISDFYLAR